MTCPLSRGISAVPCHLLRHTGIYDAICGDEFQLKTFTRKLPQ